MNPSEQEPDAVNPIADQNTERLLAGAYRPETPDPAFLARVTAVMHAAAAECVESARPAPASRSRLPVKRWIGWVAAAGLLLALGAVGGAMFLARPGFQRQDGTVWIDGKAYREASPRREPGGEREAAAPAKDQDSLNAGLQPTGVPPLGGHAEASAAGTAAPQPSASGTAAPQVLQVGQTAETGKDQRRRLALADGSILYLNRDTAVTLTAARQVTLHRGEIYVEVAQDPAATRFIVNTPRRQMIALGTKFDVRVAPAGTELLVTQGKVQVSDLPLPVLAGQQLLFDAGTRDPWSAAGPPDISAAPRATHAIEWIREPMAAAQSPLVPGSKYSGGSLVAVDPQGQETRLSLRKYHVDVHIEDGFARTTIDQTYFNHEPFRLEGTFYFPLPPDASLSRLAMYVNGRLMEGGMAERQHAREVFDSIVYRMKDPALLEWVDGSTFKMRVFPLEGRQEKRIILSYTQRLPSLYGHSEYRFPGGHSLPVIGAWSAHVRVKGAGRGEGGGGRGEQGVPSTEYGVECEPQLTPTTRDGDLLLDAAAKDIRPDRDIVVRMISNSKSQVSNPKSQIPNPKSQIPNPKSQISNPKSQISSPKSQISSPKSQVSNPKSQIPNPKSQIPSPKSQISSPKSQISSPKSQISSPKSQVSSPESTNHVKEDPSPLSPPPSPLSPLPTPVADPLRGSPACFSSALSDGSKYLMLRWRPELPGEKQRQRRDWIFLFESSGDRDRLLARAQVEIVKTILDNAEHDDTFSILTAATRVHAYQAKPQTATPVNVKRAVRFLENVHLVGALDLGRAFQAARPLVEAAENPVLVHVGSGLPVLGLRDLDALVKRVPERAAYVGVGVGNRWSRALMKSAAARSGGYFTQINPNEQIAWRALDLLATLNTPRLVGVHVGQADHGYMVPEPDRGQPGKADLQFLTCEDSLAQGEELCAIARLDAAAETPKTVEVTGQLGGKPRKWTLSVAGVAERAEYLPRTWAKLEIDRLVAEGAEKNKARIIELSKTMYVMSPFTSLLVLENEEMYAQYHVDRGRKDHWAMYACPAQIPVVSEPLVGPPSPSGTAEAKGPTTEEVLSTVLVRVPPAILDRPGARFNGVLTVPVVWVPSDLDSGGAESGTRGNFNALEELIRQTVASKSWVESGGSGDLAAFPTRLSLVISQTQEVHEQGSAAMALLPFLSAGSTHRRPSDPLRELPMFIGSEETQTGRLMFGVGVNSDAGLVGNIKLDQDASVGAALAWLSKHQTSSGSWDLSAYRNADGGWHYYPYAESGSVVGWQVMALRAARQKAFVDAMYQAEQFRLPFPDDPPIVYPDPDVWRELTARRKEIYGGTKVYPVADLVLPIRYPDEPPIVYPDAQVWRELTRRRAEKYGTTELSRRTPAGWRIEQALKQRTELEFVETPLRDVVDYLKDLHRIEIQLDYAALKEVGVDENTPITKKLKGISLRSALKLMLDELQLKYVIHNEVLLITSPPVAESEEMSGDIPDSAEMLAWVLPGYNRKVPTYQPPVFSNNPAVFYDLVSYAPAMHTNLADVLSVLEAEVPADAAAAKPGKFDDRARRLIERARGAGWQTATIAQEQDKTPLTVAFDGTGRYRYQRATSAGLREVVICDGTSLWHLYPELGIGARRTVSRFHRQDFTRLVPWALPPVEDLARGADLVSIDERSVAIVPHKFPSPRPAARAPRKGAGAEGGLQSRAAKSGQSGPITPHPGEGQGVRASLRIHLVFAPDGRLAERQLVEMPSGKILVRETYGADGTVACVTDDKKEAGGTPAPRRKILLAPCGAPELKPDAALVVLPLPLRSRQQALGTRKLLADENYGSWSEEDALAAIAADLGEGPVEMKQIIGQRFFRRGDRRVGFYTLLLSAGLKWNPKEKQAFQGGDPLLVDPLADHPHDPLAKYVAAYLASSQPGGPKDFGDPAESRSRRPEQAPGHPRYPLAGRGSVPTGDFFRQLAEFHDLWERWHDGRATAGDEAQQRQEHQRVLAFIESAQPPEFGWGLLMAIRGVLPADTFHDGFAAAIPRFQTVPGLRYAARYELARACNAEDGFRKLFTETLETGIVPRIDGSFREVLQRGDGQQWQTTIRAAAKKLIDAGARQSAVYLAFQVQQVDDPALAEEVFDMALCGAPESERLGLTLARIEHFRQTKQRPRADALLQTVLNDKRYAGWPALWYLAEAIAGDRGMTARAIGFRQRAMDIEFEHLPEKVNIDVIRSDYGQLLSRYEKLATAIGPLHEAASPELLAGVIRAADRWRQLDADPTAACQAAARVLGELGETDLAWDYLTTPLSVQANQAASWTNLAQMLRQQGHVDLADRAFVAACDAEPTNAQVLWDRAELLWENGRRDQARPLFRQIATGSWGPQFSALQSRAKQYVEK